jgi:Protein of unknown function (DUF3710)
MNDNSTSSLGPFDSEDISAVRPYLDFGSLRIEPRNDVAISVEVEEGTSKVVAVTLDHADSKLQLMVFAAPKTEGIWSDIRAAIIQNVEAQGGSIEEGFGPVGIELRAQLPLVDDQGRAAGFRLARFIGFDGPRWCLRGTISGAALTDSYSADAVHELFRSVIVHRGDSPLPPSEALPLTVPAGSVLPPGMK